MMANVQRANEDLARARLGLASRLGFLAHEPRRVARAHARERALAELHAPAEL